MFFCCLWFRVKAQNVWWKQIYRINSVNIHLVLLISCFYCLLSVSSSVWTDEERKTSLWKERPGLFTSTCTRDVAFTASSSEWMTLYVAQVFTTTFLYLFDSFLSAWCKNKKEKLVTVSINVLFCPNPKYILFLSVEEWLKIFEFYQNICSLISCRSTVHSNSKFKELEFIELAAESLLVSPKIVFWWKVFGEFIFESNVSIFLD